MSVDDGATDEDLGLRHVCNARFRGLVGSKKGTKEKM